MQDTVTTDNEAVLQSIYRAIDAINQTRPADEKIQKSPDTELNQVLDSLDKVNLIVETEMVIEEDFGESINLAGQSAVAQGSGLFRTVQTFADFIASEIG